MKNSSRFLPFEDIEEEGLIKYKGSQKDDRIRVSPNSSKKYPSNCLCFLTCRDSQEDTCSFGTIFLISKWYGLTAGHLLVRITEQSEVIPFPEMQAFPGANGEIDIQNNFIGQKPGMIRIVDFRLSTKFINNLNARQKTANDFALVKFEKPIERQKYCKITKINENLLCQADIEVIGYPYEKMSKGENGGRVVEPYRGEGKIVECSGNYHTIDHAVNTTRGQSGSPIIFDAFGSQVAIGIHNSFSKERKVNCGVFFTDTVLSQIYEWIYEMETPLLRTSGEEFVSEKCSVSKSMKSKIVVRPVHLSRIKEAQNEEQSFRFNWDISPQQKNTFKIAVNALSKKILGKSVSIITSYEPFPRGKVSSCSILLIDIGNCISFGLASRRGKKSIYDSENFSLDFPSHHELSMMIRRSKETETVCEKIFGNHNDLLFLRNNYWFDRKKYRVRIVVDNLNGFVKVERDRQDLIIWPIPKELREEDIFLSVGLAAKEEDVIELVGS